MSSTTIILYLGIISSNKLPRREVFPELLVPAIKRAKVKGVITHLFYHPSSVHNQLLDEVDELHIIDKDFLEKCKKTTID